MAGEQGFTLIEVLIALFVTAISSLSLLQYQWQLSQLINQLVITTSGLSIINNASERLITQQPLGHAEYPFQLSQTGMSLKLNWLDLKKEEP